MIERCSFLTKMLVGLFCLFLLVGERAYAVDEKGQSERFVTIDFNNVDIVVFIKFISVNTQNLSI